MAVSTLTALFSTQSTYLGQSLALWAMFLLLVLCLLAIDLLAVPKNSVPTLRYNIGCSIGYIGIAVLYGGVIAQTLGTSAMMDYYTAYVVEKSLALDNLFIIAQIFSYFSVAPRAQHRMLFLGILGVLLFRALLIGFGVALITELHDVLLAVSAILFIIGVRMLRKASSDQPHDSAVLRYIEKIFPKTKTGQPTAFWVVLLCIETADIVFALDSVPAVLAVTTVPYIVYTSNIMAVLGLRAMYGLLQKGIERFVYLEHALAILLMWIAVKVWVGRFFFVIPSGISLALTLGILGVAVLLSCRQQHQQGT
ncbi:MAG: TerC family protein [Pseudomonadota bacterium]